MKTNYILSALVSLTIGLTATAQTFTPFAAGAADIYESAKANCPSGVYNNGTTVVLNDLEDHNWTLYSDTASPIRNLYPRNVQITYLGQGKYYANYNASPNVADEQPEGALNAHFADMPANQAHMR